MSLPSEERLELVDGQRALRAHCVEHRPVLLHLGDDPLVLGAEGAQAADVDRAVGPVERRDDLFVEPLDRRHLELGVEHRRQVRPLADLDAVPLSAHRTTDTTGHQQRIDPERERQVDRTRPDLVDRRVVVDPERIHQVAAGRHLAVLQSLDGLLELGHVEGVDHRCERGLLLGRALHAHLQRHLVELRQLRVGGVVTEPGQLGRQVVEREVVELGQVLGEADQARVTE